jgi:hypothetical protein
MMAVQIADLNFVPFWPSGEAVKAINSATVTQSKQTAIFSYRQKTDLHLNRRHKRKGKALRTLDDVLEEAKAIFTS